MIKIKFVNLNFRSFGNPDVTINSNYYVLKTYYKHFGKNFNRIIWQDPMLFPDMSVERAIQEIAEDPPEILCLSFFTWNHNLTAMIGKKTRELFPSTVIIAGGPDLDAHKNDQFFNDHPYLDYVVYGDGERAFVELIDSIAEKRPINDLSENAVNIVTPELVYPHSVFKSTLFNEISPILESKEDIVRDVKKLKQFTNSHKIKLNFRWERTRGCPYACSFCDWSAGLHHKVTRKVTDWYAELKFLFSLGLNVIPTDANWGMHQEDVEITRAACKMGNFAVQNVAKLNKDQVFEIYRILFSHNNNGDFPMKMSFQDIHEDVLKNIDRPDIPWQEHKEYILDFLDDFPDTKIIGELIIGLPGQTVDRFIDQLHELETVKVTTIASYPWEILPNAPAYQQEYQKRFGIKYRSFTVLNNSQKFNTLGEIYKTIEEGGGGWINGNYVISNNTLEFEDILLMKALCHMYSVVKAMNAKIRAKDILQKALPKLQTEIKQIAETILNTNVFGVYDNKNQCWVAFDGYFSDSDKLKELVRS